MRVQEGVEGTSETREAQGGSVTAGEWISLRASKARKFLPRSGEPQQRNSDFGPRFSVRARSSTWSSERTGYRSIATVEADSRATPTLQPSAGCPRSETRSC